MEETEKNRCHSESKTTDDSELVTTWVGKVDLSSTKIIKLPELKKSQLLLTWLNLSGNLLRCKIDWLIHLKRLKWLDVSHNMITLLAETCGSIGTLEHLNVSHNQLQDLPEWVLQLEKVEYLNLGFNPLSRDSLFHQHVQHMANWKNIKICYLQNMDLSAIPECLRNAHSLKELYMGNISSSVAVCSSKPIGVNCLWSIHQDSLPTSLEVLECSHVQLAILACNWNNMVNLIHLKVQGNGLFWPSDEFTHLSKLELCDMSQSKICLLPKDIGSLNSLQFINLSFNHLASLPKSLELLEHLSHLDLYSNNIECIECDFSKFSRLTHCDLWMNNVNPNEVLPNHDDTCKRLRDSLTTDNRCSQRIPLVNNLSIEEDLYTSLHGYSRSPSRDSWMESDSERDQEPDDYNTTSGLEGEASRNESQHNTAVPVVPYVEETWDDDVYSDPDVQELRRQVVPNMASRCNKFNDEHHFLPAYLHSPSHSRLPNNFPVIKGQFDDK